MKQDLDRGSRVETHMLDAQAVLRLMKYLDVSGRELAHVAGVSPATISRLLNEKTTRVNNAAAKRIAKRLGQPFENLFRVQMFYVSRDYARRNAA